MELSKLSNYGIMLFFGQAFPLLVPILLNDCVVELRTLVGMVQKITDDYKRRMEVRDMHLKRAKEIALRGSQFPLGPAERDEMIHCLREALSAGVQLPQTGR